MIETLWPGTRVKPGLHRPFRATALVTFSAVGGLYAQVETDTVSTPELPIYVAQEEAFERSGQRVASVTGFTRRELERAQMYSPEDLAGSVPNLHVSSSSLRSFGDVYTLRGLGNTPFFSNAGVVLYVDDVPLGSAFTYALRLHDIEAMQVHRGPQGTRFGRNSQAGVIALKTGPPHDALRTRAAFGYGSFDSRTYEAALSTPLVRDQLYVRISAHRSLHNGFVFNTHLGQYTDTRDSLGGNFSLHWSPDERWEVTVRGGADRFEDGAQRIVQLSRYDHSRYSLSDEPLSVASDVRGETSIRRNHQSLRISKRTDWGRITAVTARSDWNLDPNILDLNLSPIPGFISTMRQREESWTQEVRLESQPKAKRTGWWRVGLFYMDTAIDSTSVRDFVLMPAIGGSGCCPLPIKQTTRFQTGRANVAGYGSLSRRFGDALDLTVGLRIDYAEESLARVKILHQIAGSESQPDRTVEDYADYTNVAPSLAAELTVSPGIQLFGRTAFGFKPGGFSAFTDDPNAAVFATEKSWSTEGGVFITSASGNYDLTVTAFWNEIDNYQVERSFTFTEYYITNAEDTRSRGVEVEAAIRPHERIELRVSAGYTDATFESYRDPFTGFSFEGSTVPKVPEFTATFHVSYRIPNGLFATFGVRATGKTYFAEFNPGIVYSTEFSQDSFALLQTRIGYLWKGIEISFFARNLTDRSYFTNKVVDIDAGVPGEPRTLGFEIRMPY